MALPDARVHIRDLRTVVMSPAVQVEEGSGGPRIFPSGRSAHDEGTGALIAVDRDQDVITGLSLDRPLYSNDQLYVAENDGVVFVSDFFGAVIEWLPARDRTVSEAHLVDHLLFRTVPGTETLLAGVRRVGQGETVRWRRGRGWMSETGRYPAGSQARVGRAEILDELDRALSVATAPQAGDANLFSGGVDSTLLQHYLGSGAETVTVVIDSPEFQPELEYARAARDLLNASGQEVAYHEKDYRLKLEESIRTSRLPPHHLQTVSIAEGFSTGHDRYHTAQFADALFGLGYAAHAQQAWYLRRLRYLRRVGPLLPGSWRRRFGTLQQSLESIGRRATALDSYAQLFAVYSDVDTVRSIVGAATVAERFAARLDYTLARMPTSFAANERGLETNLELGHWIDFLCDDTVAVWGQLGLGRGKQLVAPFTHPRVVEVSLRIPSPERYTRRGRAKHWLKRLLRRNVPRYPVGQTKYSSGLPFWRYYENGPLRHALRDYSRPSFLPEAVWNDLDVRPTWLTWNILTYLIWDHVVRSNAHGSVAAGAALDRRYASPSEV